MTSTAIDQFAVCTPEEESFFHEKQAREDEALISEQCARRAEDAAIEAMADAVLHHDPFADAESDALTYCSRIYAAMERSRMPRRSQIFVKLVLLYGCRPGELMRAEKGEFDLKEGVWTIPPERHKTGRKTGRALKRPIISEVAPLIQEAMRLSHSDELLFSAEASDKPMHQSSTLSYPKNIMSVAEKQLGQPMQHWSMYDLRKTARTNWSTLAEPHVCELMLGHVLPGVWQVYDRHDYLEEQADAYRKWYARVMGIVNADTAEEG